MGLGRSPFKFNVPPLHGGIIQTCRAQDSNPGRLVHDPGIFHEMATLQDFNHDTLLLAKTQNFLIQLREPFLKKLYGSRGLCFPIFQSQLDLEERKTRFPETTDLVQSVNIGMGVPSISRRAPILRDEQANRVVMKQRASREAELSSRLADRDHQ
jgi:hypothetical protein